MKKGAKPVKGATVKPDTGLPTKPDTGLPTKPDTGLPAKLDTGLPAKPDRGELPLNKTRQNSQFVPPTDSTLSRTGVGDTLMHPGSK